MKMINVTFTHPFGPQTVTLALDAESKFSALTAMLVDKGFVDAQKPGYGFIFGGHICGRAHMIGDYLADGADALTLRVFEMPQIMV